MVYSAPWRVENCAITSRISCTFVCEEGKGQLIGGHKVFFQATDSTLLNALRQAITSSSGSGSSLMFLDLISSLSSIVKSLII